MPKLKEKSNQDPPPWPRRGQAQLAGCTQKGPAYTHTIKRVLPVPWPTEEMKALAWEEVGQRVEGAWL